MNELEAKNQKQGLPTMAPPLPCGIPGISYDPTKGVPYAAQIGLEGIRKAQQFQQRIQEDQMVDETTQQEVIIENNSDDKVENNIRKKRRKTMNDSTRKGNKKPRRTNEQIKEDMADEYKRVLCLIKEGLEPYAIIKFLNISEDNFNKHLATAVYEDEITIPPKYERVIVPSTLIDQKIRDSIRAKLGVDFEENTLLCLKKEDDRIVISRFFMDENN